MASRNIVSVVHYITLHYITLYYIILHRYNIILPGEFTHILDLINLFHLSSLGALVNSLGSLCLLLFLPAGSSVISCSRRTECFCLLTAKPLSEVQSALHQPETHTV